VSGVREECVRRGAEHNTRGRVRSPKRAEHISPAPGNAAPILLLFLALNISRAEPVGLPRQVITLPANAGKPLFVDIEGDGPL